MGSSEVSLDGDSATGLWYVLEFARMGDGWRIDRLSQQQTFRDLP